MLLCLSLRLGDIYRFTWAESWDAIWGTFCLPTSFFFHSKSTYHPKGKWLLIWSQQPTKKTYKKGNHYTSNPLNSLKMLPLILWKCSARGLCVLEAWMSGSCSPVAVRELNVSVKIPRVVKIVTKTITIRPTLSSNSNI